MARACRGDLRALLRFLGERPVIDEFPDQFLSPPMHVGVVAAQAAPCSWRSAARPREDEKCSCRLLGRSSGGIAFQRETLPLAGALQDVLPAVDHVDDGNPLTGDPRFTSTSTSPVPSSRVQAVVPVSAEVADSGITSCSSADCSRPPSLRRAPSAKPSAAGSGSLPECVPAVRACLLLVDLGDQRLVEQIREQNSLWYSVGRHAGASVVVKKLVNTAFLPYGGSCVSTWIGPLGA